MKQLKFSNATFHEGENITVRRGTKWSGEGGIVLITETTQAEIIFTQCFRFIDILDINLENEHDESCRNYNGLLKEMERLYPYFSEDEIVTIIHFTPLQTPSPTGDRDCEELKKENDELRKEIERLKGFVNDDLRLAVSVLNRILTHLKMDLGAESAKRLLHEIDSLSNQEINSQERPLF